MITDPGCTRARWVTGRRSGRSLQGGSNRSKKGRSSGQERERERGRAGVLSCKGSVWSKGMRLSHQLKQRRQRSSSECHALSPVGVEVRESRIRAPSPAAVAAAASEQARADRRRQQRHRDREHHTQQSPRNTQPDFVCCLASSSSSLSERDSAATAR